MSQIENAVNFLWCCIEHEPDEILTDIDSEEAVAQVEGYQKSFVDELPELLNDPYWMKVCWNRAVRAEIKRRFGSARPIREYLDKHTGSLYEIDKAVRKLKLVFQHEPLPGPRKIYRDADGNLWEDYILTGN